MPDINFNYNNNFNSIYLAYNIENLEKIDKVEHNMITNNQINGLLNVVYSSIDGEHLYKYNIASKVSLKKYLSGCQDKERIIKILLNTLNIFVEIEDYMIMKEHIILDDNYVFVDVSNASLHFICLPIDFNSKEFNLKSFINNIIRSINSEDYTYKNFICLINEVLDKDDLVDIRKIISILKNFNYNKGIAEEDAIAVEDIKIDVVCHTESNNHKRNIRKLNDEITATKENNTDNIGFLVPGQKEKIKSTKSDNKSKINLKNIFRKSKNAKKIEAVEQKSDGIDNKKQLNENDTYKNTILIKNPIASEKTSFLYGLNSGLYPIMPYLTRKRGSEKIIINADLFRIGKEKDYVDYAIDDNNTISRAHADIIRIDKDYYIQDNNSKNHTYVNNNMVCDGQAVKLEHNCEIKLSNEIFIFKLY